MAYEDLCMYCFKELDGEAVCPHCGKDSRSAVPENHLIPGTTLYRDRFLIGRALGQDASGIVYIALDTKRGGTLRIREYLPRNCAERMEDGSVLPMPGLESTFTDGLNRLRASVEGVTDPKRRHFPFEENGTLYIAQRKTAPDGSEMSEDDDEHSSRRGIALYIGIGAAVLAAVAVAVILFLNSLTKTPDDLTLDGALVPSSSPEITWMPDATPTPTPYVAATFAPLVDPELTWMDYTYAGDVNREYEAQSNPTKAPTVDQSKNYQTVNAKSSDKSIRELQTTLRNYGWLSARKLSGVYDDATKQAVRDFQKYVNENCSPAEKLAVDGIAGKKTQQWLYNSSVRLTKPTATPTPLVTPAADTGKVGSKSSEKEIRDAQKKLQTLGLLDSVNGRYGNAMRSAVEKFQSRVNGLLRYDALDVNGELDEATMAYLDYYVRQWKQMQKATATPAPTAKPTADPSKKTINGTSSRSEISAMQGKLAALGFLNQSGVDGKYGNGTINAVKTFQKWINDLRGEETLSVSGAVDPLTMKYMDYCIETGRKYTAPTEAPTEKPTQKPTEVPTAEPTEVPTAEPTVEPTQAPAGKTVDKNSTRPEISAMQGKLAALGFIKESGVDGKYGKGTTAAVEKFQQWVNDLRGEETLEITGTVDPLTMQYMDYCIETGRRYEEAVPATEAPTAVPTPEPEQEPDPSPEPELTDDEISRIQEMLCDIGLLDSANVNGSYDAATRTAIEKLQSYVNRQLGSSKLSVNGECDDLTMQYLEYCCEHEMNVGAEISPTDEPAPIVREGGIDPDSGETNIQLTQTLLASTGLLDFDEISGVYDDATVAAVRRLQHFVNRTVGDGSLREDGVCDEETLDYLKQAADEGWNLADSEDPYDADEEDVDPVEEEFEEITVPEPEPTVTSVPQIENLSLDVDAPIEDNIYRISENSTHVSWSGDNVKYYSFVVLDDNGNEIYRKNQLSKTFEMDLPRKNLQPNRTYELRIIARGLDDNEEEISVFVLREEEATPEPTVEPTAEPTPEPTEVPTPEPTEAPTPEPTPEPYVSKPSINMGGETYQQDGVPYVAGEEVIFSWQAEGDVEDYTVVLYDDDDNAYKLGDTTETSRTVKVEQLASQNAGIWKLYVRANGAGGVTAENALVFGVPSYEVPQESFDEEPYEEPYEEDYNEPEEADEPETGNDILKIQMALYQRGLLNTDRAQQGVLDEATLEAVANFQMMLNDEFGLDLPVVDPESTTEIDEMTLAYLFGEIEP